jgi:hypothetical protein
VAVPQVVSGEFVVTRVWFISQTDYCAQGEVKCRIYFLRGALDGRDAAGTYMAPDFSDPGPPPKQVQKSDDLMLGNHGPKNSETIWAYTTYEVIVSCKSSLKYGCSCYN